MHSLDNVTTGEMFLAAMQVSFKCERCGQCCKNMNGIAYNSIDCQRMAKQLNLGVNEFRKQYTVASTKKESDRWLILGGEQEKLCPFLGEAGCTQYEGRGQVCRFFPWYSSILVGRARDGKSVQVHPNCKGMVNSFLDILELAQHTTLDRAQEVLSTDIGKMCLLHMIAAEGKEAQAAVIAKDMGYAMLPALGGLKVAARWYAAAIMAIGGPRKIQNAIDEVSKYV
jgi:Fe-S-cluster containining protein